MVKYTQVELDAMSTEELEAHSQDVYTILDAASDRGIRESVHDSIYVTKLSLMIVDRKIVQEQQH